MWSSESFKVIVLHWRPERIRFLTMVLFVIQFILYKTSDLLRIFYLFMFCTVFCCHSWTVVLLFHRFQLYFHLTRYALLSQFMSILICDNFAWLSDDFCSDNKCEFYFVIWLVILHQDVLSPISFSLGFIMCSAEWTPARKLAWGTITKFFFIWFDNEVSWLI
jgi:hypothetical protein